MYILANRSNGTLYTVVTSNLLRRVHEHREAGVPGFASKYGCRTLVWYELHGEITSAIAREQQVKAGSRSRKVALIESINPD